MSTSFFLSRRSLKPAAQSGMPPGRTGCSSPGPQRQRRHGLLPDPDRPRGGSRHPGHGLAATSASRRYLIVNYVIDTGFIRFRSEILHGSLSCVATNDAAADATIRRYKPALLVHCSATITRQSPPCPTALPPPPASPSCPPVTATRRQRPGFWPLTIGSIGVVYGDIGTSPLYAIARGRSSRSDRFRQHSE